MAGVAFTGAFVDWKPLRSRIRNRKAKQRENGEQSGSASEHIEEPARLLSKTRRR